MKTARGSWRAILLSLALALLIVGSVPYVAAVAVYVMSPPPEEPDPTFLAIVAGLTLGPGIMLAVATRRARLVSRHWDLGEVGARDSQ